MPSNRTLVALQRTRGRGLGSEAARPSLFAGHPCQGLSRFLGQHRPELAKPRGPRRAGTPEDHGLPVVLRLLQHAMNDICPITNADHCFIPLDEAPSHPAPSLLICALCRTLRDDPRRDQRRPARQDRELVEAA